MKNAAQLPCEFESYPCRSYKHNVSSEGTCYPIATYQSTSTHTSVASFTQTLQCLSKELRPLSLSTQHTNNNFHFSTRNTRCALRFTTTPWAQHTTLFELILHFHSQTHKHKATSITPVDFMTPYLMLLWLLVYAVQLFKTVYVSFFCFVFFLIPLQEKTQLVKHKANWAILMNSGNQMKDGWVNVAFSEAQPRGKPAC